MKSEARIGHAGLYRVRQFVRGLRARVELEELNEAARLLPPAAAELLHSLPADAQRHSLNVLATLRTQGPVDADLGAAALLHDVGKLAAAEAGLPLTLWLRGPLVLLDAIAPALARRLARDSGRGWRRLLHVHREHAAIGARWAAERGCSPLAVWLIANHQTDAPGEPPSGQATITDTDRSALRRLQWADNLN